jgi:acyl-CoA synthetase (AMP-forming)/AMP-acid ligase II
MTETLLAMLAAGAYAAGESPALLERREGVVVPVSHAELHGAVAAAQTALREAGVRAGDVIGLWLPNGLAYYALEFAAAGLSAAVLGINTRYGVFELAHLIVTARMKVLAHPERFIDIDFPGTLDKALAEARGRDPDLTPPRILRLNAIDGDAPDIIEDRGAPDAPMNYFTTSGSTGAPKLAGHDQASIVRHARLVARTYDIRPGDVVHGVLPLCGVFGFNSAMAALAAGATVLVEPVFDAGLALRAFREFGVTHAFGGDDLWGRIREAWVAEPVRPTALRRGAIAQFEGKAEVLAAWARAELGIELAGVYGASELFALILNRPLDPDLARQVRAGGPPLPGVEVRIGDPETGLAADAPQGEMQVRGFTVLSGYLNNPEATAKAFTADGWYRTGDLIAADGDGAFTFLCRNTEALRLRGFLVEPAEIEQCLMDHPAVITARVVGVATAHGDAPLAFVTLAAPETPEALRAYCKSRLAAFKVPVEVVILEAFPVTAGTNGAKIKLDELKRLAREKFPLPSHAAG